MRCRRCGAELRAASPVFRSAVRLYHGKYTNNFLKNQHRVAVSAESVPLLLGDTVCVHHAFVTAERRHHHELRRVGQVEIRHHRVGDGEIIGVEDELVGPALHRFYHAARRYGGLHRAHHRSAYGHHLAPVALGRVDALGTLLRHEELLRIHLMLRQILHVDGAEIAQTRVQGDEGRVDALDLHAFEQVLREVHTRRGGGHRALARGEYGLVTLGVLGLHLFAHPARQGRFAEFVKRLLELLVRAVEEEPQRAAARGGVVDHLGSHHVVVAEV